MHRQDNHHRNMNTQKIYFRINQLLSTVAVCVLLTSARAGSVEGWLHWRGPHQNGTSDESNLVEDIELGGKNHRWTFEMPGRGEAVIADGHVYAWGYQGEGPDLREYLTCLDESTGQMIWQHGFNDFLSDIVYNRYAIGAATVDAETGNVYLMSTVGEMTCFDRQGKLLWQHSMMERFGMLTFPNGRRGAAVIDGDLVIHHCITSYWGAQGPARDRFYAFNKHSGALVWSSTPGTPPKDSSFSSPVLGYHNNKRVLYAGTGCGNLVAINVRNGDPLWRYHFSFGGVNSSLLLHKNSTVIAIHGRENLDSSEVGRMAAVRIGSEPGPGQTGPAVLNREDEIWRLPHAMFTSSPVMVDNRIYQVTHTGELICVDADSGKELWMHKLENGQLHASPLYADGKLYVPMGNGNFYILKLLQDGVEVLDKVTLAGGCLGAPTVWNGKIYVHSMEKLYCFGNQEKKETPRRATNKTPETARGEVAQLQIIPPDVLLSPGERARVQVVGLDKDGWVVDRRLRPEWASFIPPNAKVKTRADASFGRRNRITADADAGTSAGAFKATLGESTGLMRARVLPSLPFTEDFESFQIAQVYPGSHRESGTSFAYPPLPWIGARFKWDIREMDGNKVLVKTLDNVLFQRATSFIGHPDTSNYTVEADVMTDGNRRMKSNVGVINQRYVIALIGNWQQLEISSNHDRIKVSVPFKWSTKQWYRIKSRVDLSKDGSGVVRAKAWPRGEDEPETWTLEVPHKVAHPKGAPGLYGFSPQTRYSVYVDNVSVYSNE
jgi:outer membrane protein assembly factor BamB